MLVIVWTVMAVLGAIRASSAMTLVEEPNSVPREGPGGVTPIGVGQSRGLTCSATTTGTELTLSTVLLGKSFKLKATGVSCLPHASREPNAKVETIAGPKALLLGRIKFSGISVVEPAGCKVPAEITTEPLRATLIEEKEGTTLKAVGERFEPTGEVFTFVPITGCAIASEPEVTGKQCALAEKEDGSNELTNEYASPQRLKFDAEVQKTFGCELKLGPSAATLMGTVDNTLTSGAVFGANAS